MTVEGSASASRVYIAVPFAENSEVSALGARWDGKAKSWYVPPGTDLASFARWTPAAAVYNDPSAEFAGALREAGLILLGAPDMDGRLHRVPVDGDTGAKKSGAYIGYLDAHPAGYIHNFKTGMKRNWKSATPAHVDDYPRHAAVIEEQRRLRETERQKLHDESVRLVGARLSVSPLAGNGHPYLARKGVEAHGVFLNDTGPVEIAGDKDVPQRWSAKGHLLVPIRNIDGQLLGAQSIDAEGRKFFPRGTRLAGGHHRIGTMDDPQNRFVVIVEGYATGATLHEATGLTVAIAFNAANLEAVAMPYRTAYPDALIVIAGDNDHHLAATIGADGRFKPNVGRLAAEHAAAAAGGHALLPVFAHDDKGTDWNDLAASMGRHELMAQWETGMASVTQRLGNSPGQNQPRGRGR